MNNSIFKTFFLSLCIIANTSFAQAQTASILPPAKTQYLDNNGKPLTSGKVYNYIPSTTTPKTTWQDAAETIPNANPVILDAGGRAKILGDGSYRQIVKDKYDNIIWDAVTSSTGSGSTPSTATGDGDLVGTIKPWAGMTAPNQYAFTYGQEVSRTTYAALFTAITSSQPTFCTSGNPTLTGLSDTTNFWIGMSVEVSCLASGFSTVISKTATTVTLAANANVTTNTTALFFPWGRGNGSTTFNLPDYRGIIPIGNNNMGGVASANLVSGPFYTTDPNSIGGFSGNQFQTLVIGNLPTFTPSGTNSSISVTSTATNVVQGTIVSSNAAGGSNGQLSSPSSPNVATAITSTGAAPIFTGTPIGSSAPFSRLPPVKTSNYIIKITPDSNSATASGVTSLGGMTGDIACGTGLTCTGNIISNNTGSGTAGYALIGNGLSTSATFQAFTQSGTGAVDRTWQSKVSDTVNVKDFGAVCDGVTDDGPAAQLAHNTGKIVIYPAGTCYIATSVVLSSGFFGAKGQGPRITNILTKAAPMPSGTEPTVDVSWNAYSLTGLSGVYFEDMTINGNTFASTNPSTSTLSDLRVPIEIINSNNTYFNNMEFFQIKAPIYNYTVPGASATLIPQLKSGQFWIAAYSGGDCNNITILNTRIKYPTFVEGGFILNCKNIWIDNFKSFDDGNPDQLSLSTPLNIFGPLTDNVWINNTYIRDHLGSAMNLSASHLKVTGSQIVGPTLYTQAVPGFPLTVTTVSGSPTATITSTACTNGDYNVSIGQTVVGSGIPASTVVTGCTGTTLSLSANATASAAGVILTMGGGGPTDQVRYGGGIDSGEELSYDLFTDQVPLQDLEFTNNTVYGVRDHCVLAGNQSAAIGTFNYSKVLIANNVCYDVPSAFRGNSIDGFTLSNNYVNDVRNYAQQFVNYYTGPVGGFGSVVNNSKNINYQNNNINGGTSASYAGLTASALYGLFTRNVNSILASNNTFRDFTTYGIFARSDNNAVDDDLRYISNAIHGSPSLGIQVGEAGFTMVRADITGNTYNGSEISSAQAVVYQSYLPNTPVGGVVGNESLRGVGVVSAVNRVEARGSATGSMPSLLAAGTDTNIDVTIGGQGTGGVRIADLTVAGVVTNDVTTGRLRSTASLPYTSLPSLSANQLLGALTATTPSGLSVPSCDTATKALQWTSGTGFACNSAVGSVTSVATGGLATGGTITSTGTVTVTAATKTDMETATSTTTAITPAQTQNHPGVAKFIAFVDASGAYNVTSGYNITTGTGSVNQTGTGVSILTMNTAFASTAYACTTSFIDAGTPITVGYARTSSSTITVTARNSTTGIANNTNYSIACFGAQ